MSAVLGADHDRDRVITPPSTFDVLGVPVSAIDPDVAVATIEGWIDAGARQYVCIAGAHGVIESRDDPELLKSFQHAGLVTPDGTPLVWVAWLRGLSHVRRVYGPDLMLRMSGTSVRPGRRHFYFGGNDGVAERLRDVLTASNPGLQVVGCLTPPFRAVTPEEDAAMVAAINAARPDILWIGLSTPKQDLWMLRHRDQLQVPVTIGVGAAFDFLSGSKKQAPRFIRENGLEWAYRLCSEPRRLYGRYSKIVPRFLQVLATEWWHRSHMT
ncbi:WecB/TagA/CpsF family glycosyltransferase [Lichenihabitans psoromatis]|uniref:WecB/TagA/CpsF family glycosyltransferase n=1 Tax=Lichenihabitans psoromatis TaxID=2528642 RepID=UPI001036DEB4|nr:WecB/TagA/CpsF family glycosyltransferase [Lichenihabitans psoromatis]